MKLTTMATTTAMLASTAAAPLAGIVSAADKTDPSIKKETTEKETIKKATNITEAKTSLDAAKKANEDALAQKAEAEKKYNALLEDMNKKQQEFANAATVEDNALGDAKATFEQAQADSQEEADVAKQVYEENKQKLAEKEAELAEKLNVYNTQLAAQKDAENRLTEAKDNASVTEEELIQKKAEYEDATKDLSEKEAELKESQSKYDELSNQINAKNEEINTITEKLNAANMDKTEAETKLAEAQKALDAATEAYNRAWEQVSNGSPEYQDAVKKVNDATASLNEAQSVLNEKQALLSQAETVLTEAENKQIDAEDEIAMAEKEVEIAEARTAYASAAEEYESANSVFQEKQVEYDDCNSELAELQAIENEKQQAVTDAENEIEETKKNIADSENRQEARKAEIDALSNSIIQCNEEINKLKLEKDVAQADFEVKVNERDNARKKQKILQNEVDDLTTAYNQAVEKAKTAEEKLKSGAYSFYADRGQATATDALTEYSYSFYNKEGNERDATSFDNMQRALDLLDEANMLRKSLGLTEYKVTDVMMAMGQANANATAIFHEHSHQFTDKGVGENIGWYFIQGKDPFEKWYDEEKAMYDAGERNQAKVGHYLALINGSYNVAGFGVSQYPFANDTGTMRDLYLDSFSHTFTISNKDAYENAYTVAEYRKILNDYIDSLKNADQTEKDAKAALEKAQADYEAITQECIQRENDVTEAGYKVLRINSNIYNQQNLITEYEEDKETKEKYYNWYQEGIDGSKEWVAQKENDLQVLRADLDSAKANSLTKQNELNDIENQLNDAKKAADERKDIMNSKKAVYENLSGANEDAISYKDAKDLENKAKDKLAEANKKRDKAADEVMAKLFERENAYTVVGTAQDYVNARKMELNDAENNRDTIMADLKNALAAKEADMNNSRNEVISIQDELNTIKDKVDEYQATYNQKINDLNLLTEQSTAQSEDVAGKIIARMNSQNNYDQAKTKYSNAKAAYAPVQTAMDNLALAKHNCNSAESAYRQATILVEALKQTVSDNKIAVDKADDKVKRSIILSVEDALGEAITDEDFAYLNDVIDALKKARDSKNSAEEIMLAANDTYEKAKAAYESTKATYNESVAELAYAQSVYDEFVAKENPKETPKEDTKENPKSEQPDGKTVLTSAPAPAKNIIASYTDEKSAPQTGDSTNLALMTIMVGAFAGMASVSLRRKIDK